MQNSIPSVRILKMDGYSVFLDESGKLNNQNAPAPTLAAVFIPENSLDAIKFDFAELTKSAKKWGANTSDPKFEFSTSHILSDNDANRSHFAGVPHNHSMKILKKMALIISRHRLLTLTTCFKRPEADRSAEAIFNTSSREFDSRFHLPGLFIGL